MTTRPAVKFDDLLEAFEFVSAGPFMEHEAWLCVETGTIHYHSESTDDLEPIPADIEDDGKYIAIPNAKDLDLGKRLVLGFARDCLPDALAEVEDIFRRKGAYARFKDLLDQRGALEQWYAYEAARRNEALRQWCADNGIALRD